MAGDVEPGAVDAGKLRLDVEATLAGFRERLQRQVDEAVKGVKAKIGAELDDQKLQTQAKAAAEAAEKANKISLQAEADVAQIRTELQQKITTAAQGLRATVVVQVEADTARARAEIETLRRQTSQPGQAALPVGADTSQGQRDFEQFRQQVSRTQIQAPQIRGLDQVLMQTGRALVSLGRFPMLASGILLLGGAIAELGGALFAVTSAAGPAVAAVAGLPGLAMAALQGVGVLFAGFSGLGKAVQALSAADKQSGQAAKAAATARRNAAEQARNAAEQLKDARQRLADARVDAARQIERAERGLEQAQRSHSRAVENATLAQEALNQAREDAVERLEDLALAASGAALNEEAAQYALIHAQRRLDEVLQSVVTTDLDKKEADLAYRQAQQRLAEAKDANEDAQKAKAKADREGVEGNKQVEDARRRVRDANQSVKDSVQGVADAEQALRDARVNGARSVQNAEKGVQNAMRAVANAARAQQEALTSNSTAARNLQDALGALSPAGQAFARFLVNTVIPRLKQLRGAVQEAILPGVQRGVTAALPFLDTLQDGLVDTGHTVGGLTERFGRFLATKGFRSDFSKIMSSNNRVIRLLAEATGSLGKALIDVTVVAAPFLERFSRWVKTLSEAAEQSTRVNRANGDMERFFERAWQKARQLKNIVRDLTMGLVAMGRAATDQGGKKGAGDTYLTDLADAMARFREWANDEDTQNKLRDWFNNAVPAVRQLGTALVEVIRALAQIGDATSGTLEGFLKVLQGVSWALEQIMKLPGAGPVLGTIFFMSGAALGIGLLATALGRVLRVFRLLGKTPGLSRLFGGGRGGRDDPARRIGQLRQGIDDLTESVEKEIPKDKAKGRELEGVGREADKTGRKAGRLGRGFDDLGDKAEKNAKKSGLLSRALSGLGGMVLAIPGVAAFAAWARQIGARMSAALAKLRPGKAITAAGEGAAKTGLLGGLMAGLLGRLPAVGGVVSRVQAWLAGLRGKLGRLFSREGAKTAATTVGKGAAKGGAKGGAGGPIGIIGGVLAGITGELIGGDQGGVRGAVGGALTGGATGAGIGATIGSIFPGIGTAIGGGVGAVIGAVVGAITGGKWWGKIAEFFTDTLPDFIGDQVKQLPGRIKSLLLTGADLTLSFNGWLLAQASKLPGLIGGLLASIGSSVVGFFSTTLPTWIGEVLKVLPGLLVDVLFFGVEMLFSALAAAPKVFGWLLNQAFEILPALVRFFLSLPGRIVGWIKAAVTGAPKAWSWLSDQARTLFYVTLPKIFSGAWGKVIAGLAEGLRRAKVKADEHLKSISQKFAQSRDGWVRVFSQAWSRIYNGVKNQLGQARDRVSTILSSMRGAFSSAVSWIGKTWSGLQGKTLSPVKWIVDHVYNGGIVPLWGKVASLVGMPGLKPLRLKFADGGMVPAGQYGVLPGYSPGRDTMLAAVSPGEGWIRPEATRWLGAGWINGINAAAKRGTGAIARFVTGGAFRDGGIVGGITGRLRKFTGWADDLFTSGLRKSAAYVLNPLRDLAGRVLGGSQWGKAIAGLPAQLINRFLNYLDTKIESRLGGDAGAVVRAAAKYIGQGDDRGVDNNNRFTRQWGWPSGTPWCALFVSTAIKDAKALKAYPGAPTAAVATFNSRMKHVSPSQGRPGDLATYGANSHVNLIEKPLGGGRYRTIGGNEGPLVKRSTRSNPATVLRPRFAGGGIVTRAMARVFAQDNLDPADATNPLLGLLRNIPPVLDRDRGGRLPPGLSIVDNATGRDEWALVPEAVDALGGARAVQALNEQAGRMYAASRAASRPAASQAGTGVLDRPEVTINVFAQPHHDEEEIAAMVSRRLGGEL